MADEPQQPTLPIKNDSESTFETRNKGWVEVSNNDDSVIFSTAQYGNYFGEITRMALSREAQEILTQGGWGQLLSYILTNFSYGLSLELIVRKGAPLPGPGDQITFPLAGVKGVVKPTPTLTATNSAGQTFTLEATSWDSLDNDGAGTRKVVAPPASIAGSDTPAVQSAPASAPVSGASSSTSKSSDK